jgi:hypothetical protein
MLGQFRRAVEHQPLITNQLRNRPYFWLSTTLATAGLSRPRPGERNCRGLVDVQRYERAIALPQAHPRRAAVSDTSSASGQQPAPEINTEVPQSARIWNYWLGGKDHFPVDRAAGDQYIEVFPGIVDIARASRGFLTRAAPACRPPTTPTRSPSGPHRRPASSTSTTTPWC